MSDIDDDSSFSQVSIGGTGLGNALTSLLDADDIEVGSDPGYQTCKTIFLYHPLGRKLAEKPVELAQTKAREIQVKEAPEEVRDAFLKKWEALGCDALIFNEHRTARIYGISTLVAVANQKDDGAALNMRKLSKIDLSFNVLDPLNTAGSLVLSQIPTDKDFQKPVQVSSSGVTYHRSRFHVTMHEMPIYLAYTNAAFGFVGRSVYQRILFPLKSYIATMRANDVIARKNTVVVYKAVSPGSIIDRAMQSIGILKRVLIKASRNGNVLQIGEKESIETLDMQNVDGSGKFARDNILKDIASGSDMPALMLNEETMVSGLADGTEDAKAIARYGEQYRLKLQPSYRFMDNYVMYSAWDEEFYENLKGRYKSLKSKSYEECFSSWRKGFTPEWPSLIEESESEKAQVEQTKINAIIEFATLLLPQLDPENCEILIEWMSENINESTLLLPHSLEFDFDSLEQHLGQQAKQKMREARAQLQNRITPPQPNVRPVPGGNRPRKAA